MESIETINQRLVDLYGKTTVGENPKYRLVFSSTQYEKRHGQFSDYYGSLYLRTVTETREVKKYPKDPDRMVLEYFQWNGNNPELITNFSYEPIWIFNAADGSGFIFPSWPAIELVIKSHQACMEGKSPAEHIKEAMENNDEDIRREAAEVMLQCEDAMSSSMFADKSAVSYANLDIKGHLRS